MHFIKIYQVKNMILTIKPQDPTVLFRVPENVCSATCEDPVVVDGVCHHSPTHGRKLRNGTSAHTAARHQLNSVQHTLKKKCCVEVVIRFALSLIKARSLLVCSTFHKERNYKYPFNNLVHLFRYSEVFIIFFFKGTLVGIE